MIRIAIPVRNPVEALIHHAIDRHRAWERRPRTPRPRVSCVSRKDKNIAMPALIELPLGGSPIPKAQSKDVTPILRRPRRRLRA